LFNPVSKSNAIKVENKYTNPPNTPKVANINSRKDFLIVEECESWMMNVGDSAIEHCLGTHR
jgi:hypothetical protein